MRQVNQGSREIFISTIKAEYGDNTTVVSRQQVLDVCEKYNLPRPHWLLIDKSYRADRGMYYLTPKDVGDQSAAAKRAVRKANRLARSGGKIIVGDIDSMVLPSNPGPFSMVVPATTSPVMEVSLYGQTMSEKIDLVPVVDVAYVPFGNYADLHSIIKSRIFYPIYITGMSGNGKTMMPEQSCAKLGRELIRANITIETDEDDLIGGMRLVNGQTVYQNGPVAIAMERGAVLLLDEVDLGSNKLMCLQPVLEGKPIFIKKANKIIYPKAGFNIIATANTKGKGSDDGRFVGTNILNEAFLERFSITMEQTYPTEKVEVEILLNNLRLLRTNIQEEDKEFITRLVKWSTVIRNSFNQGAISEIISTRRLVHIIKAYVIFGARKKAINLSIARFDTDTKNSFSSFYDMVDADANKESQEPPPLDNGVTIGTFMGSSGALPPEAATLAGSRSLPPEAATLGTPWTWAARRLLAENFRRLGRAVIST